MAGGGQWGEVGEEKGRGGQRGRQEPGQVGGLGPEKSLSLNQAQWKGLQRKAIQSDLLLKKIPFPAVQAAESELSWEDQLSGCCCGERSRHEMMGLSVSGK